jgi:hypothetical protein
VQLFASSGWMSLSKDAFPTWELGTLLAGLGGLAEFAAKSTLLAKTAAMRLGTLMRVPSQGIIATIVIRQNALKCYSKMPCHLTWVELLNSGLEVIDSMGG